MKDDFDDDEDSDDDDEDDDEPGGLDPEEAQERFDAAGSNKHEQMIEVLAQARTRHRGSQTDVLADMAEPFMPLKLVPRIFEMLVFRIRNTLENIRRNERAIMQLCVRRSKMPRKIFLKTFPGNETNLEWVEQITAGSAAYSENIKAYRDEIIRAQKEADRFDRKGLRYHAEPDQRHQPQDVSG